MVAITIHRAGPANVTGFGCVGGHLLSVSTDITSVEGGWRHAHKIFAGRPGVWGADGPRPSAAPAAGRGGTWRPPAACPPGRGMWQGGKVARWQGGAVALARGTLAPGLARRRLIGHGGGKRANDSGPVGPTRLPPHNPGRSGIFPNRSTAWIGRAGYSPSAFLAHMRENSKTASACSSVSMEPGRTRRTLATALDAVKPLVT